MEITEEATCPICLNDNLDANSLVEVVVICEKLLVDVIVNHALDDVSKDSIRNLYSVKKVTWPN